MSDEDDFADRDAEDVNPRATRATSLEKVCRGCKKEASMLHHDPDRPHEPARTICGACQGERNRKILDAIRPRKSDAPHETARKDGWR